MTDPTTPVPVTKSKPWYTSKTMWAGAITVLLGAYAVVVENQAAFGLHLPPISPAVFGILGALGLYGRATANTVIQ